MAQKEEIKKYCVYQHVAPDGRVYIGITSQKPKARWQGGNGYKNNTYFTRAIKKYGWENFGHYILADDLLEEQAKKMEIFLISFYRSNERKYGFNISSGGESKKGTHISDWQKQRISIASKGRSVSNETREKLSLATASNWKNEEFRNHMRSINLGPNNPQFGKIRTDHEKMERGGYSNERGGNYSNRSEYSNRGGYSRNSNMIMELRELMEDAPDERTRMEFDKFIRKMESM